MTSESLSKISKNVISSLVFMVLRLFALSPVVELLVIVFGVFTAEIPQVICHIAGKNKQVNELIFFYCYGLGFFFFHGVVLVKVNLLRFPVDLRFLFHLRRL